MYACLPVPLRRSDGTGPIDDDAIRDIFRRLGFQTRYDESRLNLEANEVRIGVAGDPPLMVPIGSSAHHRDLGLRNLSAETPDSVRREVGKYGIFTGASTVFHAQLYVTRVTEGEITIWCRQASLERLLPFCRKIGDCLVAGPLGSIADIDELKASKKNFTIYSGEAGAVVSHGDLTFGRFDMMLQSRMSDVALLGLSFVLWAVTFALHFVPVDVRRHDGVTSTTDPLGPTLRSFVENSWPASTIAVLTILLSLTVALVTTPRQQIRWTWQQ